MDNQIRAFIACPLPPAVQAELGRVSRELGPLFPPGVVRWVKPERMHLTLRFLGDTAVDRLDTIAGAAAAAANRPPISLHLAGLGAFPNRKRPRVLWAGLAGQLAALEACKHTLDQQLEPLGWAVEQKAFRAHLTLGRIRDSRALAGSNWELEVPPLDFQLTAVALIESQLTPQGPNYIVRRHTPFAGR